MIEEIFKIFYLTESSPNTTKERMQKRNISPTKSEKTTETSLLGKKIRIASQENRISFLQMNVKRSTKMFNLSLESHSVPFLASFLHNIVISLVIISFTLNFPPKAKAV